MKETFRPALFIYSILLLCSFSPALCLSFCHAEETADRQPSSRASTATSQKDDASEFRSSMSVIVKSIDAHLNGVIRLISDQPYNRKDAKSSYEEAFEYVSRSKSELMKIRVPAGKESLRDSALAVANAAQDLLQNSILPLIEPNLATTRINSGQAIKRMNEAFLKILEFKTKLSSFSHQQ